MEEQYIPLTFNKIIQSDRYTTFLLGTAEKRFSIYMEPGVGKNLQAFLRQEHRTRPQTHDFIGSIFQGLDIKILQVLLYDVEENIYYAKIFLAQGPDGENHILEIDTRPSDALTLAIMNDIPIYCTESLLNKASHIDA